MRSMLIAAVPLLLAGCAGKVDYVRPAQPIAQSTNIKHIARPRESVWNASVPALGKQFFVINNLDKSSGLINISYSGDPERYIDCGRITSYVKNLNGERTYDFPGAKAQQFYEIMNPGAGLFHLNRTMALEGRVNLIFEEASASSTRVTASTRYVVTRTVTAQNVAHAGTQTKTDTITFTTGSGTSFPNTIAGQSSECVANGNLEREILSAIQ